MTEKELKEHREKIEMLKAEERMVEDIEEYTDDELESLENDNTDIVILELTQELNGSKELILDFTKITGFFLESCKKQYKNIKAVKKEVINIETMDDKYHVIIASRISGAPYKSIMALDYKNYKKIVDGVRNFLQED